METWEFGEGTIWKVLNVEAPDDATGAKIIDDSYDSRMTAIKEFWSWFVLHEAELFDFEAEQDLLLNQLAAKLQDIDPNLTFEFGPREARREFVISAGGIKHSFSAAASAVHAAPKLNRWRMAALRPRRTPLNVVEFRGKSANPSQVQFSLLDNGQKAGICLFIPGFQEDDTDWKQIGYLLLDDTLGECDVELRMGLIKMFSPDVLIPGERHPLNELPIAFDKLVEQLERGLNKPN